MKHLTKIFFIVAVLSLLCLSDLFAQDKIAGVWERRGDDYEGMQVRVTKTKDGMYKGKIIAWPVKINDPCFRVGEVKWRNIQLSMAGLYQMDELLRNNWDCSTSSESKYINFTEENKISITPIFGEGSYQMWVRVKQ